MADINFEELYKGLYDHYVNAQPLSNTYQENLDKTVADINGYKPYKGIYDKGIKQNLRDLYNWNWDPSKDASYQAMSQMYTQNGQNAMKDTLAQVSARTGGLASSYAGKAAQDSFNGYMQQLAALAPQYEQNAYNRLVTGLGAMQNQDSIDYNRWQNGLQNLYSQGNFMSGLQSNQVNYLHNLLGQAPTAWQTLMQMAMANAVDEGGYGYDGGGYGGYSYTGGSSTPGDDINDANAHYQVMEWTADQLANGSSYNDVASQLINSGMTPTQAANMVGIGNNRNIYKNTISHMRNPNQV